METPAIPRVAYCTDDVNARLVKMYGLFFQAAEHSQPCPTTATLAAACECSMSAICRYITVLEEEGHVAITHLNARRIVQVVVTGRKTAPTELAITPDERRDRRTWKRADVIKLEEFIDINPDVDQDFLANFFNRSKTSIARKVTETKLKREAAGITKPSAKFHGVTTTALAAPVMLKKKVAAAYQGKTFGRVPACLWPTWDDNTPKGMKVGSCGQPTVADKPYCADHCARAYTQPRKKMESESDDQRRKTRLSCYSPSRSNGRILGD